MLSPGQSFFEDTFWAKVASRTVCLSTIALQPQILTRLTGESLCVQRCSTSPWHSQQQLQGGGQQGAGQHCVGQGVAQGSQGQQAGSGQHV